MTSQANSIVAVSAVFTNVLLWSLFPAISEYASRLNNIFVVCFYSQLFGLIVAIFFCDKRKIVKRSLAASNRAPLLLTIMAIASAALQIFFISSFTRINGVASTIILETWPLFAVFFAYFFIAQKWEPLTIGTILILAFSIIGLLMASMPEASTASVVGGFSAATLDGSGLIGIGYAVLASVASGATIVQAELARRICRARDFSDAAFTVVLLRMVPLPFLGLAAWFTGGDFLSWEALLAGLIFGITGYGLASILAIYGVRYSSNISVILIWFLAPPLGVFWLHLFYSIPITDASVFGFLIIFASNCFLNLGGVRRISLTVSITILIICTLIIANTNGAADDNYFNALFLLTTFFVVFVSFVVQRKAEIISRENISYAAFLEKASDEEKTNSKEMLSGIINGKISDYKSIRPEIINLINIRASTFFIIELICAFIFTFMIVIIGITSRENNFLSDIVTITAIFASCFLTLYAYELTSFRYSWKRLFSVAIGNYEQILVIKREIYIYLTVIIIVFTLSVSLIYNKYDGDLFEKYITF